MGRVISSNFSSRGSFVMVIRNKPEYILFSLLVVSQGCLNASHKISVCAFFVVASSLIVALLAEKRGLVPAVFLLSISVIANLSLLFLTQKLNFLVLMSFLASFASLSLSIFLIAHKGWDIKNTTSVVIVLDTLLMSLGLVDILSFEKIIFIIGQDLLFKVAYLLSILMLSKIVLSKKVSYFI